MDLSLYVYLVDVDDNIYCFNCAMKAAANGVQLKYSGRDSDHSGYDMRSTPSCTMCNELTSNEITL